VVVLPAPTVFPRDFTAPAPVQNCNKISPVVWEGGMRHAGMLMRPEVDDAEAKIALIFSAKFYILTPFSPKI